MNSTTDDPTSSSRRIGAMALIIFLSLAVPFAIVAGSLTLALAGKPLGLNQAEYKDYESGVLKNGELWITVYRPSADEANSLFNCRIKRLDLKTGVENETGLTVGNDVCRLILVNDQMLAVSEMAVYRCEPASLVKIASAPPYANWFTAAVFAYDGRLTTVTQTDDGEFRLLHLVDGEWVNGRKILLPSTKQTWFDDPQSGRKRLLPASCLQPPGMMTADFAYLGVVVDQQIHLFFESSRGVSAYRNGFEFADGDEEQAAPQHGGSPLAKVGQVEPQLQPEGDSPRDVKDEVARSALRPENAQQEVSGWEGFPSQDIADNFSAETCDRHGLLIAGWNFEGSNYLLRRDNNGTWSRIAVRMNPKSLHGICVDTVSGAAYLVDGDQQWSFARFYPIKRDAVLPEQLTIRDGVHEYLARWQRLLAGIVCAWLAHQCVLIGGIQFLSRAKSASQYRSGVRIVELASAGRRACALSVDVLLLLMMLSVVIFIPLRDFGAVWQSIEEIDVCRILWDVESTFLNRVTDDAYINFENYQSPITDDIDLLPIVQEFFTLLVLTPFLLCSMQLYVESRFGITPGKWLLGVRTVRSTLRQCSFSRVLIRDILYCLDVPLLLTAMPAAISMMLSNSQQRLGDRLADTIVVTAASLRAGDRDFENQSTPG